MRFKVSRANYKLLVRIFFNFYKFYYLFIDNGLVTLPTIVLMALMKFQNSAKANSVIVQSLSSNAATENVSPVDGGVIMR